MKEIKEMVKELRDELHGAKHYAERAVMLRDVDSAAANMYSEMARAELGHVDKLHNMAVKLIAAQKAKGVEAPEAMQAVWDWEHELMIDKVARIHTLLNMVK